jgi:tRNA splicing endonuclease
MLTIKEARKEVENAIERHVEELKQTDDYKTMLVEIQAFEENGDDGWLYIGEMGDLETKKELDIPESLTLTENGNIDGAVLDALLEGASDFVHFEKETETTRYMIQSLGEPVIYNERPDRNQYAIYSTELSLEVLKVVSEEHGFLLIEQTMRKHGVFPSLVSTDYYGGASYLSMPKEVQELSDDALMDRINEVESEVDNEGI